METKTKNLSLKAWKVRAVVEFVVEYENYCEADEDEDMEEGVYEDMDLVDPAVIKSVIEGQLVKIKSGILENRIYGDIVEVTSIEPTISESEMTLHSDSVTD